MESVVTPPSLSTLEASNGERPFVDRRQSGPNRQGGERRQFASSMTNASPEVRELGTAIDQYKLEHHRRFITFDELYQVIQSLGYHK